MLENPNNIFISKRSFDNRYSSNYLYMGRVINKQRHNDLTQSYDVELYDWGVILRQCKRASEYASYNGVGSYKSLEDGDPVMVLCKNGMLEDAIIIKSFWTAGEYDKFLGKGEGNKPGELVNDRSEANQVSIHPNRVTQPDADFEIFGSKMISSPYDSPEFHDSIVDKAKSRTHPASIIMKNGTELVSYAIGSIINYSGSNNITISSGSSDSQCTQYTRLSSTYNEIARLMESAIDTLSNAVGSNNIDPNTSIQSIVKKPTTSYRLSDFNEPLPASYRVEQNKQLSRMATDKAQSCLRQTAAMQQQILNLNNSTPSSPQRVTTDYTPPKETATKVLTTNQGVRNHKTSTQLFNERYKKLTGQLKFTGKDQKPNYEDWINLFNMEAAKVPVDLRSSLSIIVGDSLVQSLPTYQLKGSWLNQGVEGATVGSVWSSESAITSMKPKNVFIMTGLNDILNGSPKEKVLSTILDVLKNIKSGSPKTSIYVHSVLPRNVNDTINDLPINTITNDKLANIKWINTQIRIEASKLGFQYIDLYSKLVNSNNLIDGKYSLDGSQLNSNGYKLWSDVLNTYVK